MEAMNSWGAPANVATAGAIEAKAIDASTTIAKADIAKRTGALCSLFVACVGVSYGFGFMLNQHALGFQSGNASRNRATTKDLPFQKRPISPLRFTALFALVELLVDWDCQYLLKRESYRRSYSNSR